MESTIDLPGIIDYAIAQAKRLNSVLYQSTPADYKEEYPTFEDWVRHRGYFPTINKPWCTSRLKIRPSRSYLRRIYGDTVFYKLTGVRRSESTRRARIYPASRIIYKDPEFAGSYIVNPILNWTDSDVATFLYKRDMLSNNPLYAKVGVSGCYWCPFYQEEIIIRIAREFPGIYQSLIDIEKELKKPACNNHKYLRSIVYQAESQLSLF